MAGTDRTCCIAASYEAKACSLERFARLRSVSDTGVETRRCRDANPGSDMQEDARRDVPWLRQEVPDAVTVSTRVVVMDNLSSKKTIGVEAAIEAVGACV